MENYVLSICIPTYNREEKAVKQVKFIMSEVEKIPDWNKYIEILVRDNSSAHESFKYLFNSLENYNINLGRNSENVGLVGNLEVLRSESIGKYVWFVGDDDILYEGIVEKVFEACQGDSGLVFINHNAIDKANNVVLPEAFTDKHKQSIHHVFRYSGTTMMFITACVYRCDLLKHCFEKYEKRLTLPLRVSLYCAETGGVNYINDILISDYFGETSWSDKKNEVFLHQVPLDLLVSVFFSKDKLNALSSLRHYLSGRYKEFFRYQLKRPFLSMARS